MKKIGVYAWHTVVCVAVLAASATALWGLSYYWSIRQRDEAERLLQQIRVLKPGEAGLQQARQLAHEFGGLERCSSDGCSYEFDKGFGVSKSGLPFMLRRTEWDAFGLRPWQVSVRIQTGKSAVTNVEFDVVVGRGSGWLYNEGPLLGNDWGWMAVFVTINSERLGESAALERQIAAENSPQVHQAQANSSEIVVRKPAFDTPGGGKALRVLVSPNAKPATSAVAFDVNLRCVAGVPSCAELCQLAPSAWQTYSSYQRSNGWAVDQAANCAAR